MQFAWEHVTRYQTPYLDVDLVGSPDSVTLSTACDIPGKFKIVPIICKKANGEGVNMEKFLSQFWAQKINWSNVNHIVYR